MKTKRYGKSAWKHAKNAHQVPLIAIDYFQLFDKNSNNKITISSVEKFLKIQDAFFFCYLYHVLVRGHSTTMWTRRGTGDQHIIWEGFGPRKFRV